MKNLFLIFAMSIFVSKIEAQTQLTFSRGKVEVFNPISDEWSGWPAEYTYFQSNLEPTIKVTNLDDQGVEFLIDFWYNGDHNRFTVTYNGYNATNDWYKYIDDAGDEICLRGATMSYLAQNGWPDTKVQVYFWLYSKDCALLVE